MTLLIDGSSEALFETEVYQSPDSANTDFELATSGISADEEISDIEILRQNVVFFEADDYDKSEVDLKQLINRTLQRELNTDERLLIIEDVDTDERVLIMTDGVF